MGFPCACFGTRPLEFFWSQAPFFFHAPCSFETCVWGVAFSVDHAMICTRGFVIQRRNNLRDIDAE